MWVVRCTELIVGTFPIAPVHPPVTSQVVEGVEALKLLQKLNSAPIERSRTKKAQDSGLNLWASNRRVGYLGLRIRALQVTLSSTSRCPN